MKISSAIIKTTKSRVGGIFFICWLDLAKSPSRFLVVTEYGIVMHNNVLREKITTIYFLRHFLPPDTYRFSFFLANDIEHCNCWWPAGPPGLDRIYCGGAVKRIHTNGRLLRDVLVWPVCTRRRTSLTVRTVYAYVFVHTILNILFLFFNPSELRARFIRAIKFRQKTKIIIKKTTLH